MYRVTPFMLPNYFCAMFKSNDEVHMHNTRQNGNLHLNSYRLNLKKYTVRLYGPQLWTRLSKNSYYYYLIIILLLNSY